MKQLEQARTHLGQLTPRTLISVAYVLVAIVVGTWVMGQIPTAQQVVDRPFFYADRAPGVGSFTITNTTVSKQYPLAPTTQGMYVVIAGELVAEQKPLTALAQIKDANGNLTLPTAQSSCPLAQPGVATPCTLVFELPETVAADLSALQLQLFRENTNGAAVLTKQVQQ